MKAAAGAHAQYHAGHGNTRVSLFDYLVTPQGVALVQAIILVLSAAATLMSARAHGAARNADEATKHILKNSNLADASKTDGGPHTSTDTRDAA